MAVKQMWAEFKAFAFKGSLIDLAVAVVIGAAFGGVIKALVDDIIMPAVSYAVDGVRSTAEAAHEVAQKAGAAVGVTSQPSTTQSTTQSTTHPATAPAPVEPPPPPPPPAPAPPAEKKAVNIELNVGRFRVGHFIGELLNFIIIALAVFLIVVKGLGSVMRKVSRPVEPSEPTTKECPKCLSNIPIRAVKCAHCTADLAPV